MAPRGRESIQWITCVTRAGPATMPWVHEDLTTEDEVKKHFPAAIRYAGTDVGYARFCRDTKWLSYPVFDQKKGAEKGVAAWRLLDDGRVKMYSKSAGPCSTGRAFTRDALTWFGDGMIQMSLPYHYGSHDAHEYMVPNGDDQNHRIGVAIQFWVNHNPKDCVRFFLGSFRPVRKWNQGGFWKVLLVQIGSELICNIHSMIQTSQKEVTELKKKHDKEMADKDDKIKDLTEQVLSLSTQNKKLNGINKRLRENLDDIKGQLEEVKDKLQQADKGGTSKDALMVVRLRNKYQGLRDEYRKKEEELLREQEEHLRTQVMHDDDLSFKPSLVYCKQPRRPGLACTRR